MSEGLFLEPDLVLRPAACHAEVRSASIKDDSKDGQDVVSGCFDQLHSCERCPQDVRSLACAEAVISPRVPRAIQTVGCGRLQRPSLLRQAGWMNYNK